MCRCCGRLGQIKAWGWHRACYRRWLDAGKPPDGPPPPFAAALGRAEDYAEIRSRHYGLREAAERLQVSYRTAQRYEVLRQRQPT